MLIRIVKMTFVPDKVETFKSIFERQKEKIRSANGCMHLSLLQCADQANVFMTYSWWEDSSFLEAYRESELFKSTWAATKIHFEAKPEAWSMLETVKLV